MRIDWRSLRNSVKRKRGQEEHDEVLTEVTAGVSSCVSVQPSKNKDTAQETP